MFWLLQLDDQDGCAIVPADEVNAKFPEKVIRFLENKLKFVKGEPQVAMRISDVDGR